MNKVLKDTQSRTTILYYDLVDGSGINARYEFSKLISATGKKYYYKRAHEWCCGHGVLGLQLLEDNVCKTLSLSDIHLPAIVGCEFTIALNNLQDRVTAYHSELGSLPESEKWDLFIANPPWREMLLPGPEMSANDQRIKVDWHWAAHTHMFANISKHLTDDADVYLYEDGRFSNETTWAEQIKQAGLYVHGIYKDFSTPAGVKPLGYVLHLRKNLI